MFNIQIHSSGSQNGNCIQINTILVDIGITLKKAKELINLDEITEVIVSHRHSDHFKPALFNYFAKKEIPIYLSEDTIEKFNINLEEHHSVRIIEDVIDKQDDLVLIDGYKYNREKLINNEKVIFVPQKHDDLVNYAFVFEHENERLLFSTDLDTLLPSDVGHGILHLGMFDTILLEGNYDEHYLRKCIDEIIKQTNSTLDARYLNDEELKEFVARYRQRFPKEIRNSLYRAVQNLRHLSKAQARSYAKNHLKPKGKYYEIHRSNQYYEEKL